MTFELKHRLTYNTIGWANFSDNVAPLTLGHWTIFQKIAYEFDFSATHGTKFKVGPIATVIYQAAGSSTDWVHSKMGVKYAYALELRDRGQHGFMLPVAQIQPTVQETWAGIQGMAWEIVKEL